MLRWLTYMTLGLVLAAQLGCSDEAPVAPEESEPPVLPAPERLTFDFSFFQEPSPLERASKSNFFNAYVRAAVAGAVTHFLLVPPVTAFSLALHTVPSPQDAGSYLWVYTWVDGAEEAQIRLHGTPVSSGRVLWEMRVSNTEDGFENELWFEGETWKDGDEGVWRFHDFERPGKPIVARLEWGADEDGEFLRFVDTFENVGDSWSIARTARGNRSRTRMPTRSRPGSCDGTKWTAPVRYARPITTAASRRAGTKIRTTSSARRRTDRRPKKDDNSASGKAIGRPEPPGGRRIADAGSADQFAGGGTEHS